ncbi:glycosyltransferase family 4 protein [Exidia glandulosa HHB12029]|uniref:Glycosyltransferase family 4 protein n=1 Tax=Exidia glandulosa HHB12029 TaxID=1314781 RepID=A0A165DK37_EXIGL|nr:glycosyltransferase family 4 protein [Exidia glandulosa HHB12029]
MIADFFHPVVGGVENHIYMLACNLMHRGHKVIVVTHSHPPDRVGVRWLVPGLKVYHIPFPTIASSATLPNYFTFLPYLRTILLREHITIVHGHAGLSSLAQEAILHAHLMHVRTVFTDHSLFGFDDAASILTNKLLAGALRNVDAVICVSHTGRENTVLRGALEPSVAHVIPSAIIADQFKPPVVPPDTSTINIVVLSRLTYRKGVDLLVATIPLICERYPFVRFLIGGDGPKLIELLQMRERHLLHDRVELLGHVRPTDVCNVLNRAHVYLNTSLTEAFGIGILEAACAGLCIVSTRVGGVPEALPPDMISFAWPEQDDVVRALGEGIRRVKAGRHDPQLAHDRVRTFYNWTQVAERTEVVYQSVVESVDRTLWERLTRTRRLGSFAGLIYACIMLVDCLFFAVLEWLIPRDSLDYVSEEWDAARVQQYLN